VLPRRHIGQARAKIFAELQLADTFAAEAHRRAAVEHDHQVAVGLAKKTFDIGFVGARKYVPVDIARIVAFPIRTVFDEFLAKAELRRTVQANHKTLDDRFRNQLQMGEAGEHRGIEQVCVGTLRGSGHGSLPSGLVRRRHGHAL
jgi:hypothetical protein